MGSWFVLWSFFLLSLCFISIDIPYSHASNILLCVGWCSQLLLGNIRYKLYKSWVCRAVSPSLDASSKPLTRFWNEANLSFLNSYYFGRCSPELAELVPPPCYCVRSTCYSDRYHDFLVTIPSYYKDIYCAARLWNFFPLEFCSLCHHLNGLKSIEFAKWWIKILHTFLDWVF